MADEEGVYGLARVFFNAATKASEDNEDILPQEVKSPSLCATPFSVSVRPMKVSCCFP